MKTSYFMRPEGKDDTCVRLTPEEAVAMLPAVYWINTYRGSGSITLGADWERPKLVEAIHAAKAVEKSGPVAASRGYGLTIRDEAGRLYIETR